MFKDNNHSQEKKNHDAFQTVESIAEDGDVGEFSSNTTALDSGGIDDAAFASLNTDSICAAIVRRLGLKSTFLDNLSNPSAYVIEKMRMVEEREASLDNRRKENAESSNSNEQNTGPFNKGQVSTEGHSISNNIMNKQLAAFDFKRSLLSVDRTLKQDTLIFPSAESYELFKQLTKEKTNDTMDADMAVESTGGPAEKSNDGHHIIPVTFKTTGQGLPLLRMQSPLGSSLRKNGPQLIFRKYKEDTTLPSYASDDTDFETFDYCFVYLKSFANYQRFIFDFFPNTSASFKVVMFQASFKPFADFTYKGTRFRVIGTSAANGFHNRFNQQMKLLVIDDDKPSLCDEIVNEKVKSRSFFRFKKSSQEDTHVEFDIDDAATYNNPIPKTEKFVEVLKLCCAHRLAFIPKNLSPFGGLKEAAIRQPKSGPIPKRSKDLGTTEIYQDLESMLENARAKTTTTEQLSTDTEVESFSNSTLSVDEDTTVLTVIFNTLREVVVKTSGKNAKASLVAPKGGANLGYYQSFG
ncbi:hypothetical protein I9W82_002892 [Candida metapsilosis]|uniref:Uncharacterized protein n=1 Tax=Candida metapsilosis TaxID=273372 RepID=A0A8H7ZC44_9ASCO|nr:hypothetical protein I9W82_002892 [Candida metapsilosis]